MPNTWVAADGGNTWVAREGGAVPAVADAIDMAPGDVRTLVMDFGNLPEFWAGGGINPLVPPVVSVSGGSATFSTVRALPALPTTATPIGLTLILTVAPPSEVVVSPYNVSMVCSVGGTTGSFTVSVTVTLMDGTVLTRQGALVVGNT